MRKILPTIVMLIGLIAKAAATEVAADTITEVAVGVDNIAIYITAASGSPCGSGWFYSFSADSNDQTINRVLAAAMTAWTTATPVAINGVSATCNQGTNSRFTSIQTIG